MRFQRRVLLLSLAGGFPAVVGVLVLLLMGPYSAKVVLTFAFLVLFAWLALAWAVRERIIRPLQLLSNLLAALREGDYSIRARGAREDDALGLALAEVNALGAPLREQRVGALEAAALVRTVMSEIDIALFAFDEHERLVFVNRAGRKLLAQPADRLVGRTAESMGLKECLAGDARRVLETTFPGGIGRWELRRGNFRRDGQPHQLVLLTDLSRTLREEERQLWQRLVRVLGHEINNSLAPIKSIATSLQELQTRDPRPDDLDSDIEHGLTVIAARADSLNRFMLSYARLARLPRPVLKPVAVRDLVQEVVELEKRMSVTLVGGASVTVRADADQLSQLLINLTGNAVDAALETHGGVAIYWECINAQLVLSIADEGPGLPDTSNLFVPFFTTKRTGTGIGLVLCRQIAEAHGGSILVENRTDRRGCIATVRLPLG